MKVIIRAKGKINKTTLKRLIRSAQRAYRWAYAPYSKFNVGAAVLTSKNKIYSGANIENSSYGLSICAERVSIFKAISAGEKEIKALLVFTDTQDLTPPCGACLQVLTEFGKNQLIILANSKKIKILTLKELLPVGFKLEP